MEPDNFDSVVDALQSGELSRLEDIARNYADFPHGNSPFLGDSWLVVAIEHGSHAAVRWMIGKGTAVNFVDKEGYSPLHACIDSPSQSKYDILNTLLRAGADVNVKGLNSWTPLHLAAVRNDVRAVNILLGAGANTEARTDIDLFARPDEEAEALGANQAAQIIRDWRAGHGL
jgi:hypothetical protein